MVVKGETADSPDCAGIVQVLGADVGNSLIAKMRIA